jgi:hypothetical protein
VRSRSRAPSDSASRSRRRAPTERHNVRAAGEDPRDRGLRDRDALRLRDRAERLDEREVAVEVLALEAGAVGAEVPAAPGALPGPVAAQETPGEDAVGGDADAQLAAGRQHAGLDAAREQRVLDLEVHDRMDRVRPAERLGAGLREPDVADVAGLDHLRDGADRVLDRHRGIDAGGAVDVHVVRVEPAQRVGEEALDRGGPGIDARPAENSGQPAGLRLAGLFEITDRNISS